LTLASAIAARTKRIKIGTGVQVLPLCHPLRLAEEAATVDQISHGRLIFGVGRSGFPRTYEAYGVPYGESRERFAETLEILKRAWTEDSFSYKGKYYSFDNVKLTPKPFQKPWPEIRIAANSADTFPAIAKPGHGVFVAVRLGTLEELEPNITAYRKAWKEAGHPGNGKVFLRSPVYVAETDQAARDEPEESIMYFYRYLGERLVDSATRAGVRQVGPVHRSDPTDRHRRSFAPGDRGRNGEGVVRTFRARLPNKERSMNSSAATSTVDFDTMSLTCG
jgi:alkanesulfonate monooxygenase SsuD/methylene tetrahydromethanopterin reductase-like flavin-dependent oxidoreductase (luciferase family)